MTTVSPLDVLDAKIRVAIIERNKARLDGKCAAIAKATADLDHLLEQRLAARKQNA